MSKIDDELKRKLQMIQEGAFSEDPTGDLDDDDDIFDIDDLDDDFLAEVTVAILETEIGSDKMADFMAENGQMLVRDKLLTEDVAGRSYVALSPQARRQKAINLLKLRMAREAKDPRYAKAVVARKLLKRLLHDIRTDSRYVKAEQIIKRRKFKLVNNPEAMAAVKKAQALKLQ